MKTSGTAGYSGEIIFLPEKTVGYKLKPYNYFSKADTAISIVDGWKLESLNDKSDNTTLAGKLFDAALSIATTKITGDEVSLRNSGTIEKYEPLLFKIEFDANGVVTGLRQIKRNE